MTTEESQRPPEDATPAAPGPRRPTLSELAIGGVLIVGDNVAARLEVVEPPEIPMRTMETVLRPEAEWAQPDALVTARHTTLGMLAAARARTGRGGRLLNEATDALGQTLERASRPLRRSALLRPVRRRFHRYQTRGETIVAGWTEAGRREEARSRVVAEVSLSNLMQRSVADLTHHEDVQVLVQQVVQSQSTGLIEEILEEIRERMVSLDMTLARRLRRNPPETPPFRAAYLRVRPVLAAQPHVEQTMAGHYAGYVSRLVALGIDLILLMMALSLATTFINALLGLFNIEALLGRFIPTGTLPVGFGAALAGMAGTLLVAGYGVISWGLNGQTVGDFLMGVRVVRVDGHRLSFGRSILRMIGSYLSGLALFIGFVWPLFDRRRQGWHDKLAGTVVVYDWPAVPDEEFLRDELHLSPAQGWGSGVERFRD